MFLEMHSARPRFVCDMILFVVVKKNLYLLKHSHTGMLHYVFANHKVKK